MDIKLDQISRRFGSTIALDRIDLHLGPSDRAVVLIGPSGGGKSTLLRILGALDSPDSGTVAIDGERLGRDERAMLAHRRRNGFLFQAFNLFPHLTALQNLTLPLREVHGFTTADAEERANACLERFGLAEHAHKFPLQLSGGQQQRVGIARAIAAQPRLLILDEPTSALDPEMTAEVLDVVRELVDGGQRIVLSTHEMGFARAVADRIVFVGNGRILEDGTPGQVFDQPASDAVQRFLSRVMRY